MAREFEQDILQKMKQRRLKRFWSRVVSMMMCIVVFVTTYALILPAITRESETFCAIEEHTHTATCYPQEGDLICIFPEGEVHVHTQDCNPVKQDAPICGQEEVASHTHGDACALLEDKILTCTVPEGHTHDDACYNVTTSYGCGLQETAGHDHTDACYTATTVYSCGQEEAPVHSHTEACYTVSTSYSCGLEEITGHAHGNACYVTTYTCGLNEGTIHIHEEGCYVTSSALSCELEENSEHTHGDACYRYQPVCGQEVHKHDMKCFSDPAADLETAEMWKKTLPDSHTGVYADDLLAVAESQLDYMESTRNYDVAESGEIKGYTRYGAWHGTPYADWDSLFVGFCLHYAEVEDYPWQTDYSGWVEELTEQELYMDPTEYVPRVGDLIFFDLDEDENKNIDHVGIVEELDELNVTVIGGNVDNTVARKEYELLDPSIVAYAKLIEAPVIPDDNGTGDDKPQQIVEGNSEENTSEEDVDARADLVTPEEDVPLREIQQAPESGSAKRARFASALGRAGTDQNAARAAGDPLELDEYIESVTMYNTTTGQYIETGDTVTENDRIKFMISYIIDGQELADYVEGVYKENSNTVVYHLSDIFSLVESKSGVIYNSSKQAVGNYVIDGNNRTITMTFIDTYVESNARGVPIEGDISFYSTIRKITDEDGEKQDYTFSDDFTFGVIVQENQETRGDLSIKKEVASVTGDEITYRVRVTSEEGTTGPVTLTDTMSTGLTFKQGVSVKNGAGQTIDTQFNPSADGSSFTMTLPEMAPGASYTVEYKCTANKDLMGLDMTVHNTAEVTGYNNKNIPLEDDITVDYTFDALKKEGEVNDDGSITWTITVNQDKADISGWQLVDIITPNSGNSNTGTEYTGTVTIKPESGRQFPATLPYTFPEGSTDTYFVTYTTKHGVEDGDRIKNTAILRYEDDEISVDKEVGIGTPFTKEGTMGELTEDNRLPITWTVTISTQNGPIPAGTHIEDKMNGVWQRGDMYMTWEQLQTAMTTIQTALNNAEPNAVESIYVELYEQGSGVGQYYNYARLNELLPNYQECFYERFTIILAKAIPQGKTISFSYTGYGVFPNDHPQPTTFNNRIGIAGLGEIEATVNYTSGGLMVKKHAIEYYDPDDETPPQYWEDINGSPETSYSYEDLHDGYLGWSIGIDIPATYPQNAKADEDVVIFEDMPEGITLKGVELDNTSFNWPFDSLKMEDLTPQTGKLEPGKTYKWNFKVYPKDQIWVPEEYREGGTDTFIQIEVTQDEDLRITIPGIVLKSLSEASDTKMWCYFRFYTQIDEDYIWTPAEDLSWTPEDESVRYYQNTFTNSFTASYPRQDPFAMGSQSQIITKDDNEGHILKSAVVVKRDENGETDEEINLNDINYSVVLNVEGRDLIPLSNTLHITDQLTYTSTVERPLRLRLEEGSVKLYYAVKQSDGTYQRGEEIQSIKYKYTESSAASSEVTGGTVWTHTIEMDVPDGYVLLLDYTYTSAGALEVKHKVENTCSITGLAQGNLDGDHKVEIELEDTDAWANMRGITLVKVDANDDGLYLENAKFNIYIWNEDVGEEGDWVQVLNNEKTPRGDFFTDKNGILVIDPSTVQSDQFAYNTAYYIVEVESPNGYYVSPEKYYFYIVDDNSNSSTKYYEPPNFRTDTQYGPNGAHALRSGDVIYRENISEVTEISIEKFWQDYEGEPITVNGQVVSKVEVEVWQKVQGSDAAAVHYGTYQIIPDEKGNWSLTVAGLPRATQNQDGTRGANYQYFIEEVRVNGYELVDDLNNDGITSGTITLVNRRTNAYVLPETGGAGTQLYTMAGLLFLLSSMSYLMYSNHKRRRGNVQFTRKQNTSLHPQLYGKENEHGKA